MAALFVLSLIVPLSMNIGSVRLSFYRIILLILFIPGLYLLLSGRAGRIRLADISVMLICLWSGIALVAVHGFAPMVETIGILIVETLGAYLVGRCFIRTPETFHSMVRLFFIIGMVLFPFAIYETVTGQNMVLRFFDIFGRVYNNIYMDKRLGFDRVQGPFEHPILWGVFFGNLIGLVYYVLGYGRSIFGRLSRAGLIAASGALALSSGPLSALVAQIFFITWNKVLGAIKSRWYILFALAVLGYVMIDVLSNRKPFQVFVSYMAFNASTGYNRLLIWEWGTKSIMANPLFGIGFNDWVRHSWMSSSVDMFWILPAMRHGLLVGILYVGMFLWTFLSIARLKITDQRLIWYRYGYLATMFGLFMSGWTVHFWNASFVFFMFLFGSGIWMLDYKVADEEPDTDPEEEPEITSRYTRFPIAHRSRAYFARQS